MNARNTVVRTLNVVDAICQKRDGNRHSDEDVAQLIAAYAGGSVPDYQMAAWLMAIVFRGLDQQETLALTRAMIASGETIDMSPVGRRIVDKHSTGGVGDKVSLALAPIVAACGVPFGKMSGRGLGHTGGTLDKLESIPGFQVELSQEQYIEQVRAVGAAVISQTANLVPADKKMYALRDVTGTVESTPLIAASVMSKKIAGGADAIVLDVKVGSGAFMKSLEDARVLADAMIEIGNGAGREVKILITDMSTPLGDCIGNALEILEVIELLHGTAAPDLLELVETAASVLLSLSDLDISEQAALERVRTVISDGSAWTKYCEWIRAQGGDPDAALKLAPVQHTVLASSGGTITALDAFAVGHAVATLGGARAVQGASIDHGVGVRLHTRVGETIAPGDPLLTIYAKNDEAAHAAAGEIEDATLIEGGVGARRGLKRSVIIERRG